MADANGSPLEISIAAAGTRKPFGELVLTEVEAQAATLGEATGFGHRSRVGAVAAAWRELAATMRSRDADTVADLDAETVGLYAERLWVIPPGGSLLP
jgi:hypothetical protein